METAPGADEGLEGGGPGRGPFHHMETSFTEKDTEKEAPAVRKIVGEGKRT